MSESPFIDGRSPRPGGKDSESAKKEWEQTQKPKKLIGFVLLLLVVALGVGGMAIVMNTMGDEGEEEVTDKSKWLTLTNSTDSLTWVDCLIGDPEDGGMQFKKKLSPKQETLVELATLPVACSAQDEKGTEYWSWRGLRYGSPEEGIRVEVKRRDQPTEEAPPEEAAPEDGEEG